MKRIFLLKGLDCPNCSAKIEKEVGELDGVQSSVVNLMKQTLTINVTQTAVIGTVFLTTCADRQRKNYGRTERKHAF